MVKTSGISARYFISMATDAVVSWMSENAVYLNSVAVSTFRSEIVRPCPSDFGCIIYCLAGENGQRVVKIPQTHSWRKVALRANSWIRRRKLSNFDRRKSKHLNGFLCIHFGRILLKIFRKGFPNERECRLLEFRRYVHISQVKVSWWKRLKMALQKREISSPCIINK